MADRTPRRLSPNAAAVLVLVALGAGLLLWQRPWQGDGPAVAAIPDDAAARLTTQFRDLSSAGTESAFVEAAGSTSTARTFARRAWAARRELGAQDVGLRYVSGGEVADRADGSTEAVVDVSWTPGGGSGLGRTREAGVAFRVAPQADGTFAIVGVRPTDGALPLWLAGAVTVERPRGAVVIRVDGGDASLPVASMAAKARAQVARVVPGTRGRVTVVSAHTQEQMAMLVGRDVGQVEQIAAVTTRLDGRSGASAGTVVVLNPAVFSTMDRRAAQVVMTHEATHLLTGATGTRAETWVVEGFADFVALHDDTAPLSVSAGQVLQQVKAQGPPDRLPTASDFGATSHGLGAVYESAWMIFRLLGRDHGDRAVVDFYESVLDGTRLSTALESSFGLTERQLNAQWRAYLTKSASIVS